MRRLHLLFALILVSQAASTVCGQEPEVLSKLWEDSLVAGLDEKITVIKLYMEDINDDGLAEVAIVTSGKAGTRTIAQKNHINVYGADGERLWHYGIDDVVKDAALFDINNDYHLEFMVSSGQKLGTPSFSRGEIRVVSSGGDLMRSFDSTAIMMHMHVGDLDGDSYYEIAGGSEGRVFLFRSYGERVWHYPAKGDGLLPRQVYGIDMADMNGDSYLDVIAGSDRLYYINHKGSLIADLIMEPGVHELKRGFKHVMATKLTGSSYPDTLTVTLTDKLVAGKVEESPTSNEIIFSIAWTLDLGCKINNIELVNVDEDDFREVLVACSDNRVYAVDNNGWTVWDYPVDGEPTDMYLADIDGDDVDDLIVATDTGSVYLLDTQGNFKWRHRTGNPLVAVAAGDADADEKYEIIVVSEGAVVTSYMLNESYTERRKADTFYSLGQDAYIASQYDQALTHFKEAQKIYFKLGYERGLTDTETFIRRINDRLKDRTGNEAEVLYSKAQEAFFASDYASARQYAERSMQLYIKSGDREGEIKCELLILQVDKITGRIETEITLPELATTTTQAEKSAGDSSQLVMIGAVFLFLIILVIVVTKIRSGKAETIEETVESQSKGWDEDVSDLEKGVDDDEAGKKGQ